MMSTLFRRGRVGMAARRSFPHRDKRCPVVYFVVAVRWAAAAATTAVAATAVPLEASAVAPAPVGSFARRYRPTRYGPTGHCGARLRAAALRWPPYRRRRTWKVTQWAQCCGGLPWLRSAMATCVPAAARRKPTGGRTTSHRYPRTTTAKKSPGKFSPKSVARLSACRYTGASMEAPVYPG